MSLTEDATPRPRTPRPRRPPVRSLADAMRERDDAALAALLRARPDLVHPVPADLGALATRAATAASVARALDRLDRGTLAVLEALAALPEPTRITDLAGGLPGTPRRYLSATLERLRELALVWGRDTGLHLVRTVRQAYGDHPGGLGPALAAARRGVAVYADDPERAAATLRAAPAGAAEALERMLWANPVGHLPGADRVVSPESARTPAEWLLAHHLLEPLDENTVVVPREVALALRGGALVREVVPEPPTVAVRTEYDRDRVDRTGAAQAFGFVRRVDDLLQAWSISPPPVLRTGGLGVRDLARHAALLDLDPGALALVAEVAYATGLLAADGEVAETWCPTPAYDLWQTRPPAEQWTLLAAAWLASTRGPVPPATEDSARLNVLARELDRPGTSDARRAVLAAVAALPPGAGPDRTSLLTLLDWRHPRRRSPARTALYESTLREAEQLGVTGLGAMSGHGRALLVAGATPPDAAEAQAAARAPGRDPVPASVVATLDPLLPALLDHILLQADLTAVAPGPLAPDLARELMLLADVESTGGATVYRFSPTSVRRALDAGRSASDVLTLLRTRSRTPVPQPLEYLITDAARRHGAIRVGVASSYIRSDDPVALAALLVDRRAAGLGLTRLADTVLSSQSPPDVVLERLREAGFSPAVESADGSVVVLPQQHRRTPPRPRPPRLSTEPPAPTRALLDAAVRALRAGEQATANRPPALPEGAGSGRLARTSTGEALTALRAALTEGKSVWIGYADPTGTTTERVVEPLRLEGGFLTAYDLRTAQVRTFTVARITAVAAVAVG